MALWVTANKASVTFSPNRTDLTGARTSGQIKVGSFHKTNVVNATGQNQPLVPDQRVPGVVRPGQQRLAVRDLMPNLPANSNLIQFAKETAFTNAAAPQAGEGVAKAESALTFTLANAAVQTIATWIPASRQILEDAAGLQAYINSRLLYFLKLEEEQQLLSGSGSGQNLSGLITNATVFDTSVVNTGTDNYADVLRHAILQCELSMFPASAIILNPRDVARIDLIKSTTGEYLFRAPRGANSTAMWNLPVVSSFSMPEGQFLVGAFDLAAAIWDRADATVEISRDHADFFTRNLVAILVEERLALTIYRSDALIFGGFPFGS